VATDSEWFSLGGFALLALLLAALGIYGVMAFAVAQRTHEIGLRMSLGAQRGNVVLLVLREGLKLALIGLGAGLLGVFALGHFMRSTLYGVATVDVASLTAVAVTLLAFAVLASYLPARRSAETGAEVSASESAEPGWKQWSRATSSPNSPLINRVHHKYSAAKKVRSSDAYRRPKRFAAVVIPIPVENGLGDTSLVSYL
jgi:hypothetical protein